MYDDSYYILKSNNGGVKETLVATPDVHNNLTSQINTHITNYFSNVNPNSSLVNLSSEIRYCTSWHLVIANVIHSIATHEQFKNILVVPTFRDTRHKRFLLEDDRRAGRTHKLNIGNHLVPVINKVFDTSPNMYVAYPTDHISLYKYLMEQYDVNIIPSNKMYSELGLDDYVVTPPEGVKFDAVYIVGADHDSNEKFDIADLKNDFAEYCTDDFVICDDWESQNMILELQKGKLVDTFPHRINGERRDISKAASWASTHFMSKSDTNKTYDEEQKRAFSYQIFKTGFKIYQ